MVVADTVRVVVIRVGVVIVVVEVSARVVVTVDVYVVDKVARKIGPCETNTKASAAVRTTIVSDEARIAVVIARLARAIILLNI
ncbi:MAG: hypothetical protein LYZ70_07155 [Nitrososphaerales archaeon]|nr:hypothetical protein [Nitrososphaerales archaeon]